MTMPAPALPAVEAELRRWTLAGLAPQLWLRDDDAVSDTQPLRRLLGLIERHHAPLLLAVIPLNADATLARCLSGHDLVEPAVHGARHVNHAPSGRRAEEMAIERGRSAIESDLSASRTRLCDLLGPLAGTWYVPPWNRIAPEVAAWLPALGFRAISTFGPDHFRDLGLAEHNTHVDIIDWKNGRTGRPLAWIDDKLASELAAARLAGGSAVGVLTHHLAHDAAAWTAIETIFATLAQHPAARWISPTSLIGRNTDCTEHNGRCQSAGRRTSS